MGLTTPLVSAWAVTLSFGLGEGNITADLVVFSFALSALSSQCQSPLSSSINLSGFAIAATLICLDCPCLQEESKPMKKLQRTLKKQQKRKRWTVRSRKKRVKKPRMT